MTETIMLINETDDECRIAIAENNILQEMLIEHTTAEQIKNNIYKGVVVQVQTSLQAAFVDFGDKKHGFLPNSELNPYLISDKKTKKSDPIQRKLKVGQELIVQVTREATDHKGSALTTNITLPGRFMVLMPNSDKGGISKKIDDAAERERLKNFLSGIEVEEHAVIIRTAGIGRGLTELKKDYTALKKTWNDVRSSFEKIKQPGLILEEAGVVTRTLRDYYTEEIKEIWVDNPETFQKSLTFLKEVAPRRQKDLKLFVGDRSLFASYNIERQVEQLTSNDVKLKSGGSIVIDQTEALVAIDVNSGRSNQEGNIDSTALRTNLEAAEEVARQLRLRNLGGLVVIDFIDMENESYRKQVENKLSEAMNKDKAQVRFNPISQFGLLELSRQRLAVGISSTVESNCPVCNGKGKIPSLLASTNQIIRSIRELAAKGNVIRIEGELPLELVNHILNERRQSISDLELEFGVHILLRGNPELVVFNDKFLTPIFAPKKHGDKQKRDIAKADQNKRKGKKQAQPKDTDQKKPANKKEKAKDQQASTDKPREPEAREIPEKKASPPKSRKKAKAEDKAVSKDSNSIENVGGFGIHPSCLFTDVKELEQGELDEVTTAFENRLKGKAENGSTQLIDEKYLWKSYNGVDPEMPGSKDATEPELVSEQDEASQEPEKVEKKETKKARSKTKKSTPSKTGRKKQTAKKVEKQVEKETLDKDSSPAKKEEESTKSKKPAAKKTRKAADKKTKDEGETQETKSKKAPSRKPRKSTTKPTAEKEKKADKKSLKKTDDENPAEKSATKTGAKKATDKKSDEKAEKKAKSEKKVAKPKKAASSTKTKSATAKSKSSTAKKTTQKPKDNKAKTAKTKKSTSKKSSATDE